MKSLPFQIHSRFSGTASSGVSKKHYNHHDNNTLGFLIILTFFLLVISFYLFYNDVSLLSLVNSLYPWIERVEVYYLIYHAALSAGMLAGCLHALTGPDHLAALLPLCLGRRGWIGCGYGALWGFGHAVSSVTVGYIAFRMRDLLVKGNNNALLSGRYGYVGDFVVALTVMVIGVMGLYETREGASGSDSEGQAEAEPDVQQSDMISSNSSNSSRERVSIEERIEEMTSNKKNDELLDLESNRYQTNSFSSACTNGSGFIYRGVKIARCFSTSCCSQLLRRGVVCGTVFVNGIALGLSLDGFPSLAPAIMLDNRLVVAFLISYFFSTVITMSLTSGFIGETSYWITRHFDTEQEVSASVVSTPSTSKLSDHLARYTSFIACFIGWVWLIIAFMKYMFQSAVDGTNGLTVDDISYTVLRFTSAGSAAASASASGSSLSHGADLASNAGAVEGIIAAAPNNDNILVDHEFCTSTILNILSIALVAIALVVSISQEFHVSCFGLIGPSTSIKPCGTFSNLLSSCLWRRKYQKSEEELL
jgi:hypothetical protein